MSGSTKAAWRGGGARQGGKHRSSQSAGAVVGRTAQPATAVGGGAPATSGSTKAAWRGGGARQGGVANDELGTVNHGFVGGLPEEARIGGMVLQTMQSLDMAERKEAREVANPPSPVAGARERVSSANVTVVRL